MKTLLTVILWACLGSIAPVQMTPVNAVVTETPGSAEDDVFREVMTEGFIVDYTFLPSLKQQSSKSNTSAQLPDTHVTLGSGEGSAHGIDIMEGSGFTEGSSGDTPFDKSFLRSSPTVPPQSSTPEDWNSTSFATKSSPSFPSSTPRVEDKDVYITETTTVGLNPDSSVSSASSPNISSSTPVFSITHHSNTKHEAPTVSSTVPSTTRVAIGVSHNPRLVMIKEESPTSPSLLPAAPSESNMARKEIINPAMVEKQLHEPILKANPGNHSEQKDHNTPGWLIILAIVVGVAAMVIFAVGIATRDRWYGSKQAFGVSMLRGQQREQEMATFLQKEAPMETGHAADYTIVPLHEGLEKEPLS